jgi:cell division septation protein DedD
MEEQTSWKGHTFTLMIFGGIVMLCSIFFVLGMLVGRTQSVKIGTVASADAAPKASSKELALQDLPESEPPAPSLPSKPVETLTPPPAPAIEVSKPEKEQRAAAPPITMNLQVIALNKRADAEKVVDNLKKKGFRAFMLTPAPGDVNPYYRVQVGASDQFEAESLKRKLEAAGFKPIVKK